MFRNTECTLLISCWYTNVLHGILVALTTLNLNLMTLMIFWNREISSSDLPAWGQSHCHGHPTHPSVWLRLWTLWIWWQQSQLVPSALLWQLWQLYSCISLSGPDQSQPFLWRLQPLWKVGNVNTYCNIVHFAYIGKLNKRVICDLYAVMHSHPLWLTCNV